MSDNASNAFRGLYSALRANGWRVTASGDGSACTDPTRATITVPGGPSHGAWIRARQGDALAVFQPPSEDVRRISRRSREGDRWQTWEVPKVPTWPASRRPTVAEMLIAARASEGATSRTHGYVITPSKRTEYPIAPWKGARENR